MAFRYEPRADTTKQLLWPSPVSQSRLEKAPQHRDKQKISMLFSCDNPVRMSAVLQVSAMTATC